MALLGWPTVILGILVTPVLSMITFQHQFFLATHSYKLSKANFSLSQSIPLVLYLIIYCIGHVTVENMIFAFVLSQFICFIIFQILIHKSTPKGGSFSLTFAKDSFSFGIKQYLSDLVLYLTNRLDFFLVIWFLGKPGLGIYSVAVALAEIASLLPRELGTILFPAFASGRVTGETAVDILRKTLFLAMAGAFILALMGRPLIILLFGSQFSESITAFYWLLPGLVAWSSIYVTWNHTSAAGRPELGIPIFGAAAFLDTVLNLILIPKYGVVGASIAATISYCLAALFFIRIFCKKEGCSTKEALLVRFNDIQSLFKTFLEIRQAILMKSP